MKKIIFGSVSAAAILFAGAALADSGNASTITQIGTAQTASVDQTQSSGGAVSQITQGASDADANNVASVTQGGADNQSAVTQSQSLTYSANGPVSNTASVDQEGSAGSVTVIQVGNNAASVQQASGSVGETALVGQSTNGNSAAVLQQGSSEFALLNQQTGTNNIASITQSGTGSGSIAPVVQGDVRQGAGDLYRNENLPNDSVLPGASSNLTRYGPTGAYVDQAGFSNQGAISQAGTNNFADVAQGAPDSSTGNIGTVIQSAGTSNTDGVMYQQGNYNMAAINQSGGGTSYSTVWQNGNGNQAYSTQGGSETSVIAQGQTNVGLEPTHIPYPADTPANGDYASVNQQGGNDSSLVNQTGSNDSANVSQYAANASSTVTQGGSSNVATVKQ